MRNILKWVFCGVFLIAASHILKAQKSISSPITDGVYSIKIVATGKCLAIENISQDNNARLVQWDFVNQANHKFVVHKLADGSFTIQALHSRKYLDARLFYGIPDAPVIQFSPSDDIYSIWNLTFSRQQNGGQGWVIQHKKSGTAIRLAGATHYTDNGRHFIIKNPERIDANNYEAYQTFIFEKLGDVPAGFNMISEKVNIGTSPVKIKKGN